MTAAGAVTGLWQSIGAGKNLLTRFLRLLILAALTIVFVYLAILPMTWMQQAVCGLLMLALAIGLARSSDSYLVTLTLMLTSMFCTFRYGYWRVRQTVEFFGDPGNAWTALDAFFIGCLLLAELYAVVILFLGYFQSLWPLRRAPAPMPEALEEWPDVDVLIPTYNEPLDVVRFTVFAALNMDWPVEKLHIYLLDDGRREEFKRFAQEAGVGYRVRADNKHAKAGNINAALRTVDSPYVAIFDCDHAPTRSFLQMTMGWFLRDAKLAMLQTPHHFYSPDPFERNLGQFRTIPNEGELFYGVLQDGNDFWNATFFCGSCAVLRRTALDAIGGMATETVTEDAHTSLRMQIKGWNTAYINIPQAAGLATERLSAHIGQRIRWARGMIQVLRTDNPLWAPGLKPPQRICYFNAMLHFLYAAPRLIFLTAPLIYLLFSHTNVAGYWAAILAYALPHLLLANVTNSRIQGEHRHSFWNEIYETVLAPYILLPTLLALVNPRLGKFNVTAKGGLVQRTYFDSRIAQPFLTLLFFNVAGLLMAIPRFLIWDRERPGTVLMNVLWAFFNVIMLGVCTAVAREMRQVRSSVRVNLRAPVTVTLADGSTLAGESEDLSASGVRIRFERAPSASAFSPQSRVRLSFRLPGVAPDLPAAVVAMEGTSLRVRFSEMTIAEQRALTMVLYSRADAWLDWGVAHEPDKVLRSLGRIFRISLRGLAGAVRGALGREEREIGGRRGVSAASTTGLILTAALLFGGVCMAAQPKSAPMAPGQFHDSFTLAAAGSPQIELRGVDSQQSVSFSLPQTHVARTAKIHLNYAFSPALLAEMSHLKLMMNGVLFATAEPAAAANGRASGREMESEFAIPAELLAPHNTLTIEFVGHYTMVCEDSANTALWARVHRNTTIDVQGDRLQAADDLRQLPLPFLDPSVVDPYSIPIVFAQAPSPKAIQAAGVVASYFGALSEAHALRFPVRIGDLPPGNAILIAEDAAQVSPAFNLRVGAGAQVAMRTNPNDPYGKILVVAGDNADQLLMAAQAAAMRSPLLQGPQNSIASLSLPAKARADGAPRWTRTDRRIPLGEFATAEQLQSDGSGPLNIYFRTPPDLYYGDRRGARLRLAYSYNSIPLGPLSSLQVRLNNAFLGATPLGPGQEVSKWTEKSLGVPIVSLRPFSNTLSFDFAFQLQKKGGCQDTTPYNMQGAILRDSFLDLSGFPHWAAMPNLEIFANAGFPFTRFADLSETVAVLPAAPSAQEIELFVTLMGHFGRQTGAPGLRVSVASAEALRTGAGKDFLLLGVGDDQPGFDRLAGYLPVALRKDEIQVQESVSFLPALLRKLWRIFRPGETAGAGETMAGGAPDALIEGLESPYDAGGIFRQISPRSIVAIRLKDAGALDGFLTSFLRDQQGGEIAGAATVLRGDRFQSILAGGNGYHVGDLPWWRALMIWLAQEPWAVAVIVVALFLLLAVWLRLWLRQKARARLRMMQE